MSYKSALPPNQIDTATDLVKHVPSKKRDRLMPTLELYIKLSIVLFMATLVDIVVLSRTAGSSSLAGQERAARSSSSLVARATPGKAQVQSQPVIHQVQQGETVYKIAQKYRVSHEDLIEINQIEDPNVILVDRRLRIPAGSADSFSDRNSTALSKTTAKIDPADSTEDPYISNLRKEIDLLRTQNQAKTSARLNSDSVSKKRLQNHPAPSITQEVSSLPNFDLKLPTVSEADIAAARLPLPPLPNSEEYLPNAFDGYIWPAQGALTSGYGWRWGRMHKGIDIAAPIGTPIFAAASGKVIGAGWHSGFGNTVKIEHLDGSITLYAHNNTILVTHGQRVEQGEQISEMGSTGRSTGSHLHFEIRNRDRQTINPMALLARKY